VPAGHPKLKNDLRRPSIEEKKRSVQARRYLNWRAWEERRESSSRQAYRTRQRLVSRRHLESLNQKQGNNLQRDYPYPDLLRAFEVSVEGLESTDRERYLDLALFPEDQPVPESALSVLWKRREKDLSC